MDHTFGYILCCQSPALFLLAAALLIVFFVRRGKARFVAVVSLLGCIVCVALAVLLYYQGMLHKHFAVENFWQVRGPGWVGLVLVAALIVYWLIKLLKRVSVRRAAEKEANRTENLRRKELEDAKNAAYEAGRADALESAQLFHSPSVAPASEPEKTE